ncbi:hypothetical protein ACHAXT_011793 [Thalassiosira profunda]
MTADVASTVEKEMRDEAARGYAIPITKDCLLKLKGAELYPLGLAHQFTINEKGEQIPKRRVTHDLSNRKQFGLSINQRIDEDRIPETRYGHAMSRFVHLIHHIRYHHPDGRILMCKSDIEKAYRRLHTAPRIAAKCISAWETNELDDSGSMVKKFIGLLLTRLPFGSSPAPAEFSICSETVFDLAGDLLLCPKWDPSTLPSPYIDRIPPPGRLPDETPFGRALPADVHLPSFQKGGVEGYIDDGAIAVLDSPSNSRMVDRARQALPMATHLVFRPVAEDDEPLPRPDPQSIRKLAAEGQLRESLVFLGWEINSRSLSIALPQEKASAWIASIEDALSRPTISWDDAKTLVGRLNHVGYIIPSARHFLNRIRRLEYVANKHGRAMFTIDARRDLALWILFLRRARAGLSMNLVVFRLPTTVGITDASEYGIGGYCLYSGRAWRYEFTKVERKAFSLNLKEFIGSVVNSKMLLPHDQCQYPCLLSLGDSSSATGWLHSSNFDPDLHPMHAEVAREHARVTMHHDACDYSQHLPGLHNVVADSLSRDFHLSHSKLTAMLYAAQPPYLPPQLSIVPLPPTITSWIGSLAQNKPKRKTHDKHSRSWRIWLEFLQRCQVSDPYLDELEAPQKVQLLGAFMHAVRCGTFNPQSKRVSGATARTAVNHVASAIVASGRPDPTRNAAGKTDVRILRQSKAYREVDPPTRHQKALPPEVYRVILDSAASPRPAARATLLAGALFFGCRSCEYPRVPRKEQKTRPLRACDFDFRSGARIIPHDNPAIFHADTVVAKFASQKSGVYEDEIPMDKTTDPALNPVALW